MGQKRTSHFWVMTLKFQLQYIAPTKEKIVLQQPQTLTEFGFPKLHFFRILEHYDEAKSTFKKVSIVAAGE